MSDALCRVSVLIGGLSFSWQSFKLLKKRDFITAQLAEIVDKEDEEILNLRCDLHLAKKDMKEILKFWCVFGLLSLYDMYFEIFVFWIPFYYTVKFAIVIWMMAPQSRGATVIFDSIIAPQLHKHNQFIEQEVLPRISTGLSAVQRACASGYVAVTISLGSDYVLEDVEDHLERMIENIQQEKIRRMNRASTKSSELPDREESTTDQEKHLSVSSIFSYFSAATPNEEKEEPLPIPPTVPPPEAPSGGRISRSGSVGWVMNAFDSVVGLTTETRNVLLGSEGKEQQPLDSEQKHQQHTLRRERSESPKHPSFAYEPGFDDLSACEDSSDGDVNVEMKTVDSATSFVDVSSVEVDVTGLSHQRESRALPEVPENLRRRRPTTRSQTKEQPDD